MSKFVSADIARRSHIVTLYLFISVLLVACAGLWYGWQTSPQNLRISIPPNLSSGAIVKPGEFHKANVYAFALSTFREINRWEENGTIDYGKKILEMQHRLTPTYREFLVLDMNIKQEKGELKNRSRYALEVSGMSQFQPEYVNTIHEGKWEVVLHLEIVERVASLESKRIQIKYPMTVVQMNISPEKNIWGLALDGYPVDKRPERIDLASVN